MMSKTLQSLRNVKSSRNVQFLMILIFGAIVINGILFVHLERQNHEGLKNRELYEKAMVLVRKVLGTIKDAEMGQRGYIITGRDRYLMPYTNAVEIMSIHQQQLNGLITNNFSDEGKKLRSLNILVSSKLEEMQRTVWLKGQHREDEMRALINSDLGEDDMDKIRTICNGLLDDFYAKLRNEEIKVSQTLILTEISIAMLSLIVLIGIAVLRTKLNNHQKKNFSLFEALEEQNAKLITQQQDLKKLSIDFAARNGELEHFTHIISHDLRGPLTNILSLIEIMEEEDSTQQKNPVFRMLKEASSGLFHRLDDLIILLRHKQGGVLLKERIHLLELIEEVKANYKLEIEKSGTLIETDFAVTEEVLFVKIYMQSILQNLISNSIKYRNPEKVNRIYIATHDHKNNVILTVKDNGKGIDLERHGHDIFGLFKTFHNGGEDSHGVGLYLVKKQVVEMDGNIIVESEPDKGTTFFITFPK